MHDTRQASLRARSSADEILSPRPRTRPLIADRSPRSRFADPAEASRRNRKAGRPWRRWRRRALALMLAFALAAGSWTYVVASRPGNENFIAKSADWFRDHHLNAVANWVEREWYSHQAPPTGGHPGRSIAASTIATESGAPGGKGGPTLPATVSSPASPTLPNEGVWQSLVSTADGHPVMAEAQIRPDAVHTSVLGALVWIDPTKVQLLEVPGTVEPGGQWPFAGTVPPELRPRLVAAFNGGFRFKDAAGGYYSNGKAAPALVDGMASFVVRSDGTVDVGQWGRDDHMGPDIVSVRQNLPLIVDAGHAVAGIDDNTNNRWGDTLGSRVFVWRSALGVRADGGLVYAASDGLTAVSLADMLVRAGAVRAMELDINPNWVTFNLFTHPNPADRAATNGSKLLPDMHRTADRYLGPDSRDFTAVLLR